MNNTFHQRLYLFLLFLSILLISCPGYSQSYDHRSLDSLKQRSITGDIEITEKIDLWNQIANCYLNIDLDSTAHYAEKAKYLSMEIDYKKGMAVSILRLAQVEEMLENYDNAITLFNKTIEIYEGLEKDANYLRALILLGIIYEIRQDFDKALDYYMTGLREAELQGHKLFMAYFNNNISIIYSYTGFHDKELIFIKKASEMFKELGHDNYYANSLLNIGLYYQSVKQLDTALFYFHEAEKLQKKNNNYYGLTNIYSILGDISLEENHFDEALNFYQKSLVSATLMDSLDPDRKNRISSANFYIGNTLLKLGEFSFAKNYFYKTSSSGKDLKSLLHQKQGSYGLFSCFLNSNQPDSAMFYLDLFLALNDSLTAETYNEKIDKLNYEYKLEKEREQQELQTKLLEIEYQRKELTYIILLVSILSLLFIFISVYFFQKNKMKRNALNRKTILLKKENLEKEIEYKNKQLATNVINLIRKNEFIKNISEKLRNTSFGVEDENQNAIDTIIYELDKSSSNDLWRDFEVRFQEVHGDFYTRLINRFPDLTPNEQKLCAFLYLKMSTKEIASITFQSYETLRTARYRLRKKLGISHNENLIAFLTQV